MVIFLFSETFANNWLRANEIDLSQGIGIKKQFFKILKSY